jgi:hypothetical protein
MISESYCFGCNNWFVGPIDMELHFYRQTIASPTYATVRATRSANDIAPLQKKTHIITAASERTDGLAKLLYSAEIAGVDIKVVGLGRPYKGYQSKAEWYIEALGAIGSNVTIRDDEVVVLIDAYDVFVFPSVRRLSQRLSEFPTPIVVCGYEYTKHINSLTKCCFL